MSEVGYVKACKVLAVARALVNACLDIPSERTVPYFAASKRASTNTEEQRKDNRAANEAAVTKLAKFSGSKVGESWIEAGYVGVDTAMIYALQKRKGERMYMRKRKGENYF